MIFQTHRSNTTTLVCVHIPKQLTRNSPIACRHWHSHTPALFPSANPAASQEWRQLSANIDTLIVQPKASGLRNDAEVEVRRVISLDKPNVITLAEESSFVSPIQGNFVRHLILVGPGQKRALAARPGDFETSAVVAFLQAACLDLAVVGKSAHVAGVIHVDVAVGEVVEGDVGGGRSGFAGEVAVDGAMREGRVGVALVEFQSGDIDVFDGVEAEAAIIESRAKFRKPCDRRPLYIAILLGIIFSPSAALPDSAVRVGCQDEDEVQAMLNVADVLSTSRGSLLFADLLG